MGFFSALGKAARNIIGGAIEIVGDLLPGDFGVTLSIPSGALL